MIIFDALNDAAELLAETRRFDGLTYRHETTLSKCQYALVLAKGFR